MPRALDPALYAQAVSDVTSRYGCRTSAYRSMAIVKRYKELGGRYAKNKRGGGAGGGTSRWLREKWIQVRPYLLLGRKVACGAGAQHSGRGGLPPPPPACRPSKRVSARTPLTVDEVVALHGRDAVLRFVGRRGGCARRTQTDLENPYAFRVLKKKASVPTRECVPMTRTMNLILIDNNDDNDDHSPFSWSPMGTMLFPSSDDLCSLFNRSACEFGLLSEETRQIVLRAQKGVTACKQFHTRDTRLKSSLHMCVDTIEFLHDRCGVRLAFAPMLAALLQRLKLEHSLPGQSFQFFKKCRSKVFKEVNRLDARTKARLDVYRQRCKDIRVDEARQALDFYIKNKNKRNINITKP